MARIFISYATPDRVIVDELAGWLRAAGHEPFLAHDLCDGVNIGEDWEEPALPVIGHDQPQQLVLPSAEWAG